MKIIKNGCYGGFGVKSWVLDQLKITQDYADPHELRTNSELIKLIEKYGSEAVSDSQAKLIIVTIPDEAYWIVDEYNGWERIIWSLSPIHSE